MNDIPLKEIKRVYRIKTSKIEVNIADCTKKIKECKEEIEDKEKQIKEQFERINVNQDTTRKINEVQLSSVVEGYQRKILHEIDILEDEKYLLEYKEHQIEENIKNLNREKMLLIHKETEIINFIK